MNRKQNDYQIIISTFFYLWPEIAQIFILYDLGAETNISDV